MIRGQLPECFVETTPGDSGKSHLEDWVHQELCKEFCLFFGTMLLSSFLFCHCSTTSRLKFWTCFQFLPSLFVRLRTSRPSTVWVAGLAFCTFRPLLIFLRLFVRPYLELYPPPHFRQNLHFSCYWFSWWGWIYQWRVCRFIFRPGKIWRSFCWES